MPLDVNEINALVETQGGFVDDVMKAVTQFKSFEPGSAAEQDEHRRRARLARWVLTPWIAAATSAANASKPHALRSLAAPLVASPLRLSSTPR